MSSSKTVLITGATAGIGKHVALHLARKGHKVFATGRNAAALARLLDEAKGTALETLQLDVTDAASIAAAKDEVERRTGGAGLDVLVNNAGYGIAGPLEEVDESAVRAMFDTNVFGLVAVTRAFLPSMRRRGSGRILNVSSVGGRITFPLFGAYNATKYAVESLSDSLRYELAPFGVQVVLIEPGVIRSEFSDRSMSTLPKPGPESPYAAIYARADRIKEQADAQAVGPECIAEAIERAITARRPAARYVAPFRTRILLALVALLPTRWVDAAMRAMVGLTPRRPARRGAPPPRRAPAAGGGAGGARA